MPIFEYKCERCGIKIEKWLSYVGSKFPVYCTKFEDNIFKRCNGRMKKIGVDSRAATSGPGWQMYGYSDKQLRTYLKK